MSIYMSMAWRHTSGPRGYIAQLRFPVPHQSCMSMGGIFDRPNRYVGEPWSTALVSEPCPSSTALVSEPCPSSTALVAILKILLSLPGSVSLVYTHVYSHVYTHVQCLPKGLCTCLCTCSTTTLPLRAVSWPLQSLAYGDMAAHPLGLDLWYFGPLLVRMSNCVVSGSELALKPDCLTVITGACILVLRICPYMCLCTRVCMHVDSHVHSRVHTHVHTQVYMCGCTPVYIRCPYT